MLFTGPAHPSVFSRFLTQASSSKASGYTLRRLSPSRLGEQSGHCRPPLRALPAMLVLAACLASAENGDAAITQCFGAPGVGLCLPGSTSCEVSTSVAIEHNAVIDCGSLDLLIRNGLGKLTVDGKMTIRARNLTVESTRRIESIATSPAKAEIVIELSGRLTLPGILAARNTGGGGEIRVIVAEDILLQGGGTGIDVTGEGQGMDGGELLLQAGRDVRVASKIVANGNSGTGQNDQNSGGDVEISAGAGVYIDQLISLYGRWFNGGRLSITAAGDVELNHDHDGTINGRKGELDLSGRVEDGDGGTLEVKAGGRVLISGPVSAAGGLGSGGGNAQGGDVRIDAGCSGVRIEDSIELSGGMAGGGSLSVNSRGAVALAGEVQLSGRKLGGDGGNANLISEKGNVILESASRIYTNAHVTSNTAEGVGGTVSLMGCQVDVLGGAVVEATGQTKGRFVAASLKKGTALEGSFGTRISENADISSYSTGGKILLRVPTRLDGYCSNSPSTVCTLDSQCAGINCTSGDCVTGNPQTDGQVVQFSMIPIIEVDAGLGPCDVSCQ